MSMVKEEYKFPDELEKTAQTPQEDDVEIEGFNDFFSNALKYIYDFVKQEFPFIDTTRKIAF